MLADNERQFVIEVITGYLAGINNVRATAIMGLPEPLKADVADGATPRLLAQSVIDIAIRDGWNMAPRPTLVLVLDSFRHLNPKFPEFIARIEASRPSAAADPLSAVVLDTLSPFVDRSTLRNSLRGLGSGSHCQIMVVNGPPKSGRSYTKELLMHYCRAPAVTLCCASKASWTEPSDLAADLVTAVGGDSRDIPPSDTNQERWMAQLANWVLQKANEARRRESTQFWFLLDGFGGADLSKPLRDFIVQLADRIVTGVFAANRFCLILLEFERASLTVPVGKVVTDDSIAADDREIEAGVKAILAANSSLAAAHHQAFADRSVRGLPSSGERRMPVLNLRLRALLDVLAVARKAEEPLGETELLARFDDRLWQIDDQEVALQARAILAASGKVPAGEVQPFIDRIAQGLPRGDDRAPVLDERLRALQEVLQ